MDRRSFVPRDTSDRPPPRCAPKINGPTPIMSPPTRARVPPRIAPPILPLRKTPPTVPPRKTPNVPPRNPPPVVPPRNPRRKTRSLETSESIDRFSQPVSERRLSRMPNGDIYEIPYTKSTSDPLPTASLRRSNSTISRLRAPIASRTNSEEELSHSLHEEIKSLRQIFIDRQADDVFSPVTSPHRRASNASLPTSIRNFSLPTYSTPSTRPTQPLRSLRRVRSRSVNLGPVAEASEVSDYPVPYEPSFRSESSYRSEYPRRSSSPQAFASREFARPGPEPQVEPADRPTSSRPAIVDKPLPPVKSDMSRSSTKSEPRPLRRAPALVEVKRRSEACKYCKHNMKALAMNPVCCVDKPERGKVCFHCWSELLAYGVSKNDPDDWLRCLVCYQELEAGDAKRLADWKTIMKYKVKARTKKFRESLPLGSYGKG